MSEARPSQAAPGPDVPDDLSAPPEAPPKTHLPAAPLCEAARAERLVEAGEELEEAEPPKHVGKLPGDQESQGQHGG
jgi:hypothetical protein